MYQTEQGTTHGNSDQAGNTIDQIAKMGVRSWTKSFLNGQGMNPDLAKGIEWHARFYLGPLELSLNRLHRIAGPESDMSYKALSNEWEQTVTEYEDLLREGVQPPPLIVVDFLDDSLAIADGNKRFEALIRSGIERYLAVLCLRRDPRIYNL